MEPYGRTGSDQTRNDFQKNKSYAIKVAQGGVKPGAKTKHFSQTISKSKLKNVPQNTGALDRGTGKSQTNFKTPITPMKNAPKNSTKELGHNQ